MYLEKVFCICNCDKKIRYFEIRIQIMFIVSLVLISEMYIRELIKVYIDERAYIRNANCTSCPGFWHMGTVVCLCYIRVNYLIN